ncbi:MAG: peptide chain release factor N(5)-glutamine methyltransferase [Candidatus Doudnabacteria bacterium]|nr:peptide chain release factor N(5)-glutamine methyltransferase [Candidatus Doudnabacteria bacterium]
MSIEQAIKKYSSIEIDLLLSHILGKSKEFLFLHPEYELSNNQVRKLSSFVKRRQKGEPMAYILGYKDFCGLRFKVNRSVLIPRPETEELVRKIMEHETWSIKHVRPIRILDVGTGSGCIAISLAKLSQSIIHNSRFIIHASDISKKALAVARQNARAHGVEIKFIHSDILQNVGISFDIIVANLPYGWKAWQNNTSAETVGLKFEPKEALFTKENGLRHIRRLIEQISKLPSKPIAILLEYDPRQKNPLAKTIKEHLPSFQIKFYTDFNGLWRYAEIRSFSI